MSVSADSLIVSLDDVRRIADRSDLSSDPNFDVRQPRGMHQYDSEYPSQCQVEFDQDVAFGNDWKQFRSVEYSGAGNNAVTQAVAIYSDPAAARAAFDRVSSALTACSGLQVPNLAFTVRQQDPSTVARCGDNQCSELYRVKSSVLISVAVAHFPRTAEQIANSVLQTISDRINTA
ncbi:MAG TPA: sensor domain-containing protein [Mycobacterium sp.]|nr:sensor domain-containing protein [Mycobacterium sp.]